MEKETVALNEEVSAVLLRKLPQKLKDPGSFTILCIIETQRFEKALLDLGASINLMPFSVFESLKIGELKGTSISSTRDGGCSHSRKRSPFDPWKTVREDDKDNDQCL
ncbi:hypothetical protein Dsin_000698 [Dipteronia sinensis]|uniref:Uncharacterized protein n=1 Tax=Dipteronia sinensis TaxID=43782 RepID=A0AAE0EIA2_9ROSI|nr:hypothetical protein Dsin_000698 [Dipteronia sinensis]